MKWLTEKEYHENARLVLLTEVVCGECDKKCAITEEGKKAPFVVCPYCYSKIRRENYV